jgi:hypothetical protein
MFQNDDQIDCLKTYSMTKMTNKFHLMQYLMPYPFVSVIHLELTLENNILVNYLHNILRLRTQINTIR